MWPAWCKIQGPFQSFGIFCCDDLWTAHTKLSLWWAVLALPTVPDDSAGPDGPFFEKHYKTTKELQNANMIYQWEALISDSVHRQTALTMKTAALIRFVREQISACIPIFSGSWRSLKEVIVENSRGFLRHLPTILWDLGRWNKQRIISRQIFFSHQRISLHIGTRCYSPPYTFSKRSIKKFIHR